MARPPVSTADCRPRPDSPEEHGSAPFPISPTEQSTENQKPVDPPPYLTFFIIGTAKKQVTMAGVSKAR